MRVIWQGDIDEHKGHWKGAKRDGTRTANVSCPDCGRIASLSGHEIAGDGRVSPSLVCPYDGCAFHDFVTLDGWSEP